MSASLEELDYRETPIGGLMLRRRRLIQMGGLEIYEVKLGEDFLMTSLFHEAEYQLSKIGLACLKGEKLNVVVGGLGLGYTAVSALEDERINSLVVIEFLEGVIHWHKTGLVPLGKTLTDDPRCQLVHDDFFALSKDVAKSFNPEKPGLKHDAILLDIDHTPTRLLNPTNARFYTREGLTELMQHLNPGGVFGLWADGFPEDEFTALLKDIFETADAHTITFDNPLTGCASEGTVYIAQKSTNDNV